MENRKENEEFSGLEIAMEQFADDIERRKLMEPAKPFSPVQMTAEAKKMRLTAGKRDFWAFDGFYFTPDMYSDGYSKPAPYHKTIIRHMQQPGVDIETGPRKHAKTVTSKKGFVWLMLTKLKFAATMSSTLPVSRNILADVCELLHNERILYDFGIDFIEENSEQITFRITGGRGLKRIIALSEGRSAKGATFGFARPQLILIDDIETLQSPLGTEQTEKRIAIISEAFQSMSNDGSIIVLGNNFDERCFINRLLTEQNDGILDKNWRIHRNPAWDGKKPLWPQRYPAKSESELKIMVKCRTDAEWESEFQQNPIPPDGFIFKRLNPLPIWDHIPEDAKGVLYCDPNLAKKSKGDSTAILSYLYSAKEDCRYITEFACRSFADSNDLLDRVFSMKNIAHRVLGFDGNVNQESTWTNFVRNWCVIKKQPSPYIKYCRYHVDELAKNVQALWNEGKIKLPPWIITSDEGKRALAQLFSFAGKKANRADDFPDGLICSEELLNERGLCRRFKITADNFRVLTDIHPF